MLWLVIQDRELGNAVFMMLRVDGLQRERNTMHRFNNKEEEQYITPPPPPITVILPDRFGAVARAINNHGFSSVYNMNSKQEAKRKVLQLCKIENASPCKIYLEYANGCISMASGKGRFNRYYPVYSISQQQGQTQRDVMEKCSAQYSDCGIAIEEECSIARPPR